MHRFTPYLLLTLLLGPRCLGAISTLSWKSFGPHRVTELRIEDQGRPGFRAMPPEETGVTFANQLTDRQVAENRIRENGSGVALGDVNGDAWTDIYLCRLDGPNALYLNRGNWRFEEVALDSGIARPGRFSTGAAFADVDGDGDLDLLATSIGGGVQIYHNDGSGQFSADTQSNLIPQLGASSLAIADINNDGDLDFYVANYRTTTIRDGRDSASAEVKRINGEIVVTPEDRFRALETPNGSLTIVERGEPDILYVNRGKGIFTPVPWNSGAFLNARRQPLKTAPRFWSLSALFHDLNGDQHPELYVCNDFAFSQDQFYFSRQGRQFQAYSPYSFRSISLSSMAVDVSDLDRDGDQDLLVVEMLSRDPAYRQRQRANALSLRQMPPPLTDPAFVPEILRNTLFLNRGDHSFAEVAQFSGLDATEWSWGVAFLDVDLDGWEDCLVTNGNFHDVIDADATKRLEQMGEGSSLEEDVKRLQLFPRLELANLAFRNLGNLRFEEMGRTWGFDTKGISHGLALGDLDNDGDLDVVVNHLNDPAGLYQNTTPAPRIAVRLRGAGENRFGIGASIELTSADLPQSQSMIAGGRYLSGDDPIQCFAVPDLEEAKLTVTWRNNRRTVIEPLEPNRLYEIHETPATLPPDRQPQERPTPIFAPSEVTLPSRHREAPFNDLERQPLLSRLYSRLGPSLAWFDLNRDGWDDLIMGSGRGGRVAVFINQQGTRFSEQATPPLSTPIPRDLGAILGTRDRAGNAVVLASASNYEDGSPRGTGVYQYELASQRRLEAIPSSPSSFGPLALSDIDGDGDLDLFVGGRIVPGRYPEAASSHIYLQDPEGWRLDSNHERVFKDLGLASAASFADLNGDHRPDLIVALEWGPIRVFLNEQGTLRDATATWGLLGHTGWWNGIATGDFNNDGHLDLVASNWGRNTRYQAYRAQPLSIHYGRFNRSNRLTSIESFHDPLSGQNKPWIDLDLLAQDLPELKRRFPTYRAFSEASLETILAPYRGQTKQLGATTLEHHVFLNEGTQFSAIPLPDEAQFSPAFGLGVADFDGDGNHDIALAQNFFHLEPTLSRYDAGRGLLMLGQGDGTFRTLTGNESGIRLYGEQRALALSDYDRDGRIDLATSESHGPVHLLRNVSGTPGLRVTLEGPPSNPEAIGTQVRLGAPDHWGPVTEIKTATGYWSQDSNQIVIYGPSREHLWIRWPDGQEVIKDLPPDAREFKATQM